MVFRRLSINFLSLRVLWSEKHKIEQLLFFILFGIGGDPFSQEEWTVCPAIYIHNPMLAATLRTQPIPEFYAQALALVTDTYLTRYHIP